MTVLRRPPTWDEAKKQLGDSSFMQKLLEFDKDKLDDALLKKIAKYTAVRSCIAVLPAVYLYAAGDRAFLFALAAIGRVCKHTSHYNRHASPPPAEP